MHSHHVHATVCHYNYRCKRDYLVYSFFTLEAFNNVYSNIVYVVLGVWLYCYIWVQDKKDYVCDCSASWLMYFTLA